MKVLKPAFHRKPERSGQMYNYLVLLYWDEVEGGFSENNILLDGYIN